MRHWRKQRNERTQPMNSEQVSLPHCLSIPLSLSLTVSPSHYLSLLLSLPLIVFPCFSHGFRIVSTSHCFSHCLCLTVSPSHYFSHCFSYCFLIISPSCRTGIDRICRIPLFSPSGFRTPNRQIGRDKRWRSGRAYFYYTKSCRSAVDAAGCRAMGGQQAGARCTSDAGGMFLLLT